MYSSSPPKFQPRTGATGMGRVVFQIHNKCSIETPDNSNVISKTTDIRTVLAIHFISRRTEQFPPAGTSAEINTVGNRNVQGSTSWTPEGHRISAHTRTRPAMGVETSSLAVGKNRDHGAFLVSDTYLHGGQPLCVIARCTV